MKTRLLVLFKNIDGGTGTYLDSLLEVKKIFKKQDLDIKVLVLESPSYRLQKDKQFIFFSTDKTHSSKYKLSNIYRFIKEIIWFRREVRNFQPEVVISEDLHSIFISEISKSIFKESYRTIGIIYNNIQKVIEYKTSKYFHRVVKFVISLCLKKSFLIATVSNKLSDSIYNSFGLIKKPITIATALPFRHRRKKRLSKKINGTVITIARLDNQKDHETLLAAFKIVITKIPEAKLWIVGDGPKRKELMIKTRKLGLSRNVKFYGWVQDPSRLLVKSDLFVLATKWEGFGLVILEAMSHAIPVIASDCDFGPSEIIGNNEFGVLSPVGDVNFLANTIVELLKNRDLNKHYAEAGYKRSKSFTQAIALPLYKQIIISAKNG